MTVEERLIAIEKRIGIIPYTSTERKIMDDKETAMKTKLKSMIGESPYEPSDSIDYCIRGKEGDTFHPGKQTKGECNGRL